MKDNGILEALKRNNQTIAIQGELIGPAIQENYEKVDKNEFYVYDVFDINKQEYLMPVESQTTAANLSLNYVPVLFQDFKLKHLPGLDPVEKDARTIMDAILKFAEGAGLRAGVKREGLVFKSNTGPHSFKAISNSYLLHKDKK